MKILSTISIHYPAKGKREYPNLSGRSCYLDLIPNSSHLFTRNCVKAGGENYNQILGVKGLKHYFGNWDWGDYPECQHNSFSLCFNWQEEHLMVKSLTKVSAQLQLIQFSLFFFFQHKILCKLTSTFKQASQRFLLLTSKFSHKL